MQEETSDRLLSLLLGSTLLGHLWWQVSGSSPPTGAVQDQQKLRPHVSHRMIKGSGCEGPWL